MLWGPSFLKFVALLCPLFTSIMKSLCNEMDPTIIDVDEISPPSRTSSRSPTISFFDNGQNKQPKRLINDLNEDRETKNEDKR